MSPRQRAPRILPAQPRYGVIDIGTNAVKLVVASVEGGRVVPCHFGRRATRLGEGLAGSARISAAAVRRTAIAVEELSRIARRHGAGEVIAVGTYALRAAVNGRAVAASIARHAGVPVRVLSGAEEGRLVLAAVRARAPRSRRDLLVADIGGGSAQVSLSREGNPPLVRSVPLGAVVLTETYLPHDPIRPAELGRMTAHIDAVVSRLFARMPVFDAAHTLLVAAGGTATTALSMAGVPPRAPLASLSLAQLSGLQERCLAATVEERRGFPGMTPDRADIMPAGLAVLIAIMRHANKRSLRVFAGGWREGFILDREDAAHRSRARIRSRERGPAGARKAR